MWAKLSYDLPKKDTAVIPLHKKFLRYAGAACIAIGLFSAGYFYAPKSDKPQTISQAEKAPPDELLYIASYGGALPVVLHYFLLLIATTGPGFKTSGFIDFSG